MLGPESEHPSLVLCLLTNHILPAYGIVSESEKAPDAEREIPDLYALSVAQGVQYVSGLMQLVSQPPKYLTTAVRSILAEFFHSPSSIGKKQMWNTVQRVT